MTAGGVEIAGEDLVLRPDRSLFWPRAKSLVIADPHFGKAETFRAAGVPVPGGTAEPLARLGAALSDTAAEHLLVLGDFWHAREGRTARVAGELAAWRAARPELGVRLVRGNHDRAGPPPDGWGEWSGAFRAEPFVLAHFPEPSDGGYVLAGHLHPGVTLGRERLRLPCFWFGARVGVLPAFGAFTGAANVPIRRADRVFAVAGGAVVDVSRR
ncbi:dead deah box helicase : Metallophosphoesterase, DNA ligase-associated OS=uncultured bacterium PE=4 SV=1 [Gemmata massiliana]|uniref:Calcineurin-like phosphoesterase domain-containing protein n=1 Tax=Gemmata massiliana TaxID=1210884 RepID=A0A6P2DJQ8_9BACT|nr:ligase-associated DNA damage response endonuclease PdeM [Gemmata massiliana]VTS00695.1 dead deah box helicase : Metallophosphoesterase, DNA ligase-associated OS=uncultured bacterium PE=4 SV=1 [Gemmata massiliana]